MLMHVKIVILTICYIYYNQLCSGFWGGKISASVSSSTASCSYQLEEAVLMINNLTIVVQQGVEVWDKGSLADMVDHYGQLTNYLFYLFSKVWRSMIWYERSLAGMVDHYGQLMNYLFYLLSKVWRSVIWYEGSLATWLTITASL